MCEWNVYLFKCNCATLGLKRFCHQHRPKQTANCNEIQLVREEWMHLQDRVCHQHIGLEEFYANGPTVQWRDIESRVYQLAKDHAARGDFPGKPE
ncbi:hypothetical protein FVEN_g12722 [Fusarium venenatum]|uniref:Uncharacterized protein n=1 Tax=Fusarium venenatum TaxID=56646 RepID=A0A2L2SR93_9HYPO|nr:uncharacterized protein FVRRES_13437 [Fusarium venenatum]KAG8358404.1 hypothetical protein FVEN_g12722 [Fusarium venenatum]CEI41135.1 unnamed protein product [Fusarium venenatum]